MGGGNSEKSGFLTTITIFAKCLQFYMWFYKGIKVNISATTQKFIVALIYKINPIQITTNYCRKHQKFVKLGTSHNRKYPIKNCEKFSPIVS